MNYMIARPWKKKELVPLLIDDLCVWAFGPGGDQILRGDAKHAQNALDYVKRTDDEKANDWAIYEVEIRKFKEAK